MKQIYVLLFFCCCISFRSNAQNEKKYWIEGKLSWNDFQDKYLEIGGSLPDYYISYVFENSKIENYKVIRHKAIAYLNKSLSYVTEYAKKEQILAYHQVEFDIVEVYRRKLQTELYQIENLTNLKPTFEENMQQLQMELENFRYATHYGSNLPVLQKWETGVTQKLNSMPVDPLPKFEVKSFGFGIFMGPEYTAFSGNFNNYLKPTPSFALGLEMNYKKSLLTLNATLGEAKLKKDLTLDEQLTTDKNYGFTLANVTYGYSFVNNEKYKITPFFGIGVNQISETVDEKEKKDSFLQNAFSTNYGVNLDYKFAKSLNTIPTFGNSKMMSYFYVRSRFHVSHANFAPHFKGTSYNLGVNFGMYIRKIKINN